MKVISTLRIVLSSLVGFANAETAKQDEKNIEICPRNLTTIGKVIQAYHNERGDFPKWLSELYPKYLPDASLLLCPADEEGGKSAYPINLESLSPTFPQPTLTVIRFRWSNIAGKSSYSTFGQSGAVSVP